MSGWDDPVARIRELEAEVTRLRDVVEVCPVDQCGPVRRGRSCPRQVEDERDALREQLNVARELHGAAAYHAERLAEQLAVERAARHRDTVKPTGTYLNADGTISPILPATASAEPETDWAAVATRVTGALAETKAERDALRETVAALAEASIREGRGGTWVHDGWFAAALGGQQ